MAEATAASVGVPVAGGVDAPVAGDVDVPVAGGVGVISGITLAPAEVT